MKHLGRGAEVGCNQAQRSTGTETQCGDISASTRHGTSVVSNITPDSTVLLVLVSLLVRCNLARFKRAYLNQQPRHSRLGAPELCGVAVCEVAMLAVKER